MIDKIMKKKEIIEKPPVLLDVGASGSLPCLWKKISKYSICIGFDADKRETSFTEGDNSFYKKLYIYNKIVSDKVGKNDFYLTKSPWCSSTLKPNSKALKDWAFSELFKVNKKIILESIDLLTALNKLNLNYLDWFKADSQGTDLLVFKGLGKQIMRKVIVADFEPGIMDSYIREDKLYSIMKFMEELSFWSSDLRVCGTQRITNESFNKYFNKYQKRFFQLLLKKSPFWCEISYFNSFKNTEIFTLRDVLLGCVFAIIKEQYGFALELSLLGENKFNDPIFKEIRNFSIMKIKKKTYKIIPYIFKRVIQKITQR